MYSTTNDKDLYEVWNRHKEWGTIPAVYFRMYEIWDRYEQCVKKQDLTGFFRNTSVLMKEILSMTGTINDYEPLPPITRVLSDTSSMVDHSADRIGDLDDEIRVQYDQLLESAAEEFSEQIPPLDKSDHSND
jgi:hypothetical protein